MAEVSTKVFFKVGHALNLADNCSRLASTSIAGRLSRTSLGSQGRKCKAHVPQTMFNAQTA
eukprot:694322-Pleurochrysis_carterae.AAC.3